MNQPESYDPIARHLLSLTCPRPLRVAVDGVDAAGKTTLANALAHLINSSSRPVIRSSIDGFHHPRAHRYRRGLDSPEGYYEDSFDLPALRRLLLDPLGQMDHTSVYTQLFDFRSDSPSPVEAIPAAIDAILLFDGVFLQRPELTGCWECVIFVQVDFETVLKRATQRDTALFGSPQAVRERYLRRYIPAQQRYLRECQPAEHADIIVHNDDPAHPVIRFQPRR